MFELLWLSCEVNRDLIESHGTAEDEHDLPLRAVGEHPEPGGHARFVPNHRRHIRLADAAAHIVQEDDVVVMPAQKHRPPRVRPAGCVLGSSHRSASISLLCGSLS